MSKLYELDEKKAWKEIKKFVKTYYGKVIILLSYSISTLLFLLTIVYLLSCIIYNVEIGRIIILLLLASTYISFVIGSAYFYSKLERFIKDNEGKN